MKSILKSSPLVFMTFICINSIIAQSLLYKPALDVTQPESVTFSAAFDVSNETASSSSVSFNSSGTKMYVVGFGDGVHQYSLTTPFDISSGVTHDGTGDFSAEDTHLQDIIFDGSGTKMYILGGIGKDINQYSLSIPYDVTTGVSFDGSPYDISSQTNSPQGMAMSPDGTKLFILAFGGLVHQYTISTPFVLTSGVTYDNVTFNVGTEELDAEAIAFSADGAKMFIAGSDGDEIDQYLLDTPFDLNSGATFQGSSILIVAQTSAPRDIFFSPLEDRMFITGGTVNVNQYDLGVYKFFENEMNDGGLEGELIIEISGETFTQQNGSLSTPEDYVISSLPQGLIPNISVSSDGYTASLTFTGNAIFNQEANDINDLVFTFQNSAFTGGDASSVSNAIDASSGFGIDFEAGSNLEQPTIIYSRPIDITDPSKISLIASKSSQTTMPTGITFNRDGGKMYVLGDSEFQEAIRQFSLATPFDIANIELDGAIGVGTQDTGPRDLTFSTDGTKMFIVGYDGGNIEVNQYSLSVPFDITSDVTHDGPFGISAEEEYPSGITFSTDGTKMFITGFSDEVNQYSLSVPFNITSGITFDGNPFTVSGDGINPESIRFNADGSKMFLAGLGGVFQYELSTPFDVTSGVSFSGSPYSTSSEESVPTGIAFSSDGSQMFIVGHSYNVHQYYIESSVFSEAEANDGTVDGSMIIKLEHDQFSLPGDILPYNSHYTIPNLTEGLNPQLAVSPDGITATLTFSDFAFDSDDAADINELVITFANQAFVGNDASMVLNAVSAHTGFGIDFDDNNSPEFEVPLSATFPENVISMYDIDANNGDGGGADEGITYVMEEENDWELFVLDGATGALAFKDPPDYEDPKDLDGDNTYLIKVIADDGYLAAIGFFSITVVDEQEAPVFVSANNVTYIENSTEKVIDVDANDGDGGSTDSGIIFSITGGVDQNFFDIDVFGAITFTSSPDFENPSDNDIDNVYLVEVTANDGFLTAVQNISITVVNQDEMPVFESVSTVFFEENSSAIILDVNANDGDGGNADVNISYSLTGGADHSLFDIDDSGGLTFINAPDFEDPVDSDGDNIYLVEVSASDGTSSLSQLITITVTDVNENSNPIISDQTFSVEDNLPDGTIIGTLVATDPDGDNLTFSSTIDSNDPFALSSAGVLRIEDALLLDHKAVATWGFSVEVSDGMGGTAVAGLIIKVVAGNDPPTISDQTFNVDENSPNGTIIGTLEATDPEGDQLIFTSSIDTNDPFTLSSEGVLSVENTSLLSFQSMSAWSFSVEASDGNGGLATASLIINVNQVLSAIEDLSDVIIYPNPVSQYLNIKYSEPATIQVISLDGKVRISKKLKSEKAIDLTGLISGQYIIQLLNGSELIYSGKILKN